MAELGETTPHTLADSFHTSSSGFKELEVHLNKILADKRHFQNKHEVKGKMNENSIV